MSQEEQLASCLGSGKSTLGFGDLSQLAMIALHRVGGIDQAPDFCGVSEKGSQIFPVILPGANGDGIFVTPFFVELA